MRVSAYAAKLEWDYVREWGFARERPKGRRWALYAMVDRGDLAGPLLDALERYVSAQRALEPRGRANCVSDARAAAGDAHAAKLARIAARALLDDADAVLRAKLRPRAYQMWVRAVAHDRPHTNVLRDAFGCDHRAVVRDLTAALTRLSAHWAAREPRSEHNAA